MCVEKLESARPEALRNQIIDECAKAINKRTQQLCSDPEVCYQESDTGATVINPRYSDHVEALDEAEAIVLALKTIPFPTRTQTGEDMKDQSPAFPVQDCSKWQYHGMSLRDYFAIHCDQPGQQEIITEAGVMVQEYCGLKYGDPEREKLPTWVAWWTSLSQERRFDLYAAVRFKIADAMLKAREPQGERDK